MATRYIYLVRHGQYTVEDPNAEVHDGSLTELGREQSVLLARHLSDYKISRVAYSPLKRAVETAAVIFNSIPNSHPEADPLLEECIPNVPPDGMLSANQKKFFADLPAEMIEGGERQARQVFEKYFQPLAGDEDSHEVLVSHGNLISYLIIRALGSAPETWINTDLMNGAVSVVLVRADGLRRLVSHNETGFIPFNKRTW